MLGILVTHNAQEDSRMPSKVVSCSADGRSCRELRVDPRTAKTLRDSHDMNFDMRPPAGGKSAAQIANKP